MKHVYLLESENNVAVVSSVVFNQPVTTLDINIKVTK
jgi:hypothetical protein